MPEIITQNRSELPDPRDTTAHLFVVGQTVRLKAKFTISTSRFSGIYRITRRLPPEGDVLQYRIRNDLEPHERVVKQDGLEAVEKQPADGDRVEEARKDISSKLSTRFVRGH